MMGKNSITFQLNDSRRDRLDALIAHSDFEGHGKQSDYFRSLIDEAASKNPKIDFEDPSEPISDDESLEYYPTLFEGLLNSDQVREILNTEKAPAIDPADCPPAWKPREKKMQALLMASHYRYFIYYNDEYSQGEKSIEKSIYSVVDKTFGDFQDISKYKKAVRGYIDQYGITTSNAVRVDDLNIETWNQRINNMLENHSEISSEDIKLRIEQGEKFKRKLEGKQKFVSVLEETLEKLRKRQA